MVSKVHPDLRCNYFDRIDSKEKAYWLGFIYADGCINIDKRSEGTRRLMIKIKKEDDFLIKAFAKTIGFNSNSIKLNKNNGMLRIIIGNKKLTIDLINWGVIPRKSQVIKMPKFQKREYYLAFLLGFFEGDGTEGTSKITSGSKKFLEQIKQLFNLNFKIHQKQGKGKGYDLFLGKELFNEMLDNYKHSLPRKRNKFSINAEKISKMKVNAWKGHHKRKFIITQEKLEILVWKIPKSEIARIYNVSDTTIAKWCKKLGIKSPSRGYWSKKHNQIIDHQNNDK
ncbi:MAG: LAGLIDADG family homing endonuclease [Promethearchaeota archaeon]